MITQLRYMIADVLEDIGSRIQARAIADIDLALEHERGTVAGEFTLLSLEFGNALNSLADAIDPPAKWSST